MAVNQKRLVEEFEKLVSIDSLSFQERKMADYLKERWQELRDCLLTIDHYEQSRSRFHDN